MRPRPSPALACCLALAFAVGPAGVFADDPPADRSTLEETILASAQGGASLDGGYDPRGRRDPFAGPGVPVEDDEHRAPGIAGFDIGDLDLQGIVITPDGAERYALVLAPDAKGYSLSVGDALHDGEVVAIDKDRVRYRRRLSNPLVIDPYEPVVHVLDPQAR